MVNNKRRKIILKLKIWEIALFVALAISLTISASAVSGQRQLSEKLIRLHVVGKSNSDSDQAAKLKVRDAVCECVEPLLEKAVTNAQAAECLKENMFLIESAAANAAAETGQGSVNVTLTEECFPTRDYDTFSLPAGEYLSLRVTIGEGAGRNWWCVVFPPLCSSAAYGGEMETFSLSESESAFITSGYTVRFKILDIIKDLRDLLGI